jgi:maltose O-acetyltransferase
VLSKNSRIEFESLVKNDSGKTSSIEIGENTYVRGELIVYDYAGEIKIGNDCFVGQGSRIWSSSKITIGNRVLISHNVNIHDNNSHPLDPIERHNHYKHIMSKGLNLQIPLNEKDIIIEDDVWIGFNSTILKGVKIGKGSIIGSNTIVTMDVPENSVFIGNPGKIINK